MGNVLRGCLVAIVILAFMIPSTTFAGWQSLKDVHKSALKDALAFAPAEFQKTFAPYEEKMLNEVDSLHALNPPSWYKYQDYYQTTVKIISTKESSSYDTAARFLTDMTIYLFAKYAPIKAYESCKQDEILKRAYVVYDGRNSEIDYQKMTNDYFKEAYQYSSKKNEEKLLEFYNRLVNETLNVWISIWENAGEDVADIPQKDSILREKHPTSLASQKQGISNIEIESNGVQPPDEVRTFKAADVTRYQYPKQDTKNSSSFNGANFKTSSFLNGLMKVTNEVGGSALKNFQNNQKISHEYNSKVLRGEILPPERSSDSQNTGKGYQMYPDGTYGPNTGKGYQVYPDGTYGSNTGKGYQLYPGGKYGPITGKGDQVYPDGTYGPSFGKGYQMYPDGTYGPKY